MSQQILTLPTPINYATFKVERRTRSIFPVVQDLSDIATIHHEDQPAAFIVSDNNNASRGNGGHS